MNYFLAKTDPETFSIQDFAREKITNWDGVHSYEAINVIKSWQIGDLVLIYHSQGQAKIVGLAKVVTEPIPDSNDKRKISWCAKLELIRVFEEENQVSLKEIKESQKFVDFKLVKQSRLSTMACPKDFIDWLKIEKNLEI
jgi:predicted RNA-binding protein with PUA-like domain